MIKKALAIIALVMIASLSVAGCTQSSPTSSPTPTPITSKETVIGNNMTFSSSTGFNITYPKTLKIDSNNSTDSQNRVYIYLVTNNTLDSVNVATADLTPNATLSDWATYVRDSVNDFPNWQLISNQSTTLGGKPAYTIVWQATVPVQNDSNVQNTTLKVMQTTLINNNTGYIVTYKATLDDYNTYLAQAQRIMNSFELTS
ncbi:MAG: hypothetical protein ABSC87_04735 [Halobacteriota archaeon]|jgi:nitrous oxide reductase accessory protein NosL